jgi:NAD(P)H-dependent FMN reductase
VSEFTVLVLLGSLRRSSLNRRLAHAAVAAAPAGTTVLVQPDLETLPHYNEDHDAAGLRPASVERFWADLNQAGAVLVVTPQYNGTMSSVVKNAIDWGSRPARDSPLTGKPAAAIGATYGRHGGELSQAEARRALSIAGAVVVEAPTIGVGAAHERFARCAPEQDEDLMSSLTHLLSALRLAAGDPRRTARTG